MNKVMKIFAVMFLAILVISVSSPMGFATITKPDPMGTIDGIEADANTEAAGELQQMAGKVIGLIQVASAVAAIVLISVFGFKFIIGSANEKAEYQKSFIPLIIGVVVVFAATSIAKLLFGIVATAA